MNGQSQPINNLIKIHMPFGKYRNKSIPWLILNTPNYMQWLMDNADSAQTSEVKKSLKLFIDWFDMLPFNDVSCQGDNGKCSNSVKYMTVPNGKVVEDPIYWCTMCDPKSYYNNKNYVKVEKYNQALLYVTANCLDKVINQCRIITYLRRAKGFPKSATDMQILNIFYQNKPAEFDPEINYFGKRVPVFSRSETKKICKRI